jgi:hypothetical protein
METIKKTKMVYQWQDLKKTKTNACVNGHGGTSLASTEYEEMTSPIYKGEESFEYDNKKYETKWTLVPYTIQIDLPTKRTYTLSNSKVYSVQENGKEDYFFYTLFEVSNQDQEELQVFEIRDNVMQSFPICGVELKLTNGRIIGINAVSTLSFSYHFKEILTPQQKSKTYIFINLNQVTNQIPMDSIKSISLSFEDEYSFKNVPMDTFKSK